MEPDRGEESVCLFMSSQTLDGWDGDFGRAGACGMERRAQDPSTQCINAKVSSSSRPGIGFGSDLGRELSFLSAVSRAGARQVRVAGHIMRSPVLS